MNNIIYCYTIIGGYMSKSILMKEYNKANIVNKEFETLYQDIDVSFLDILNGNEIDVVVKIYDNCVCKDSTHLSEFFNVCDKCKGTGIINLNGHELVCNECKGEKYLRINNCYLCNNKGKILKDSEIKLVMSKSYKSGDIITLDYQTYKIELKLNVVDKDNYLIKGNDVYLLKAIKYSKQDYSNKNSKLIKTVVDYSKVKSEFKIKNEIVKLEGKGLNGGDFYFSFENEIEIEKKTIYTNILLNDTGYVKISDLVNEKIVCARNSIALNYNDYVFVDENVDKYENDEYVINFNKFDVENFEFIDNEYYYVVDLDKEDLDADKKNILINGEKVNLSIKKNAKEISYLYLENKGFVNKLGKKEGIKVKVNPYFENIYKISIKKNKNIVYVDDYKYFDYRLVMSLTKSDYLTDYIKIKDEDKVYVDNDLVLIKRV